MVIIILILMLIVNILTVAISLLAVKKGGYKNALVHIWRKLFMLIKPKGLSNNPIDPSTKVDGKKVLKAMEDEQRKGLPEEDDDPIARGGVYEQDQAMKELNK